jgi:hypothetical protein
MKLEDDIPVAAPAHVVRHPPYIDRPAEAEYPNLNRGGIRAAGIAAPVPAVADVTKQGRREASGPAARVGRLNEHPGQAVLDTHQVPAELGPQGGLDSPGELLERQAPREKVIAEHDDSLLAVSVGDAQGRIVHGSTLDRGEARTNTRRGRG